MATAKWETQKVHGRDEVLLDIEKRANAYSERVVQDVRGVMHDYEVDMYRLVLSIGRHYGMDKAYEIMSETVVAKRLRWLDQEVDVLKLAGSDVQKALDLYVKYFRLKEENFRIIEQNEERVVFARKDFVDAISHACNVLGLDVVEVNNKVYAKAMNQLFARINPGLKQVILKHRDGWYEEMIELR
jgi:hypothetical protein